MKNIIIPVISGLIVGSAVYAFTSESDPSVLIEKQNRKSVIDCMDSLGGFTGSAIELQSELKRCSEIELMSITGTASGTPVSSAPSGNGSKTVSIDCEFGRIEHVEGIEYHYTATDDETTLQSLKNGHKLKGMEYIGYHYVIKPDGEITNTRDESCVAGADKWSKNNYRFIQIAFVGDDKPTREQGESMARLAKDIQLRYKLPIDSVSAHYEWGPKSPKESLEYWFGSKEEFIKMIRYWYVISIYGNGSPELQYMWRAWGDLDFIATIFQESRMNNNSVGDGGKSFGYCQIHKGFQPGWHSEYMKLKTMEERLNYCYEKYVYASTLKGGVGSRFHGYNARQKHKDKITLE